MAWRGAGDKSLSEPMEWWSCLLTHICVTRPRCVTKLGDVFSVCSEYTEIKRLNPGGTWNHNFLALAIDIFLFVNLTFQIQIHSAECEVKIWNANTVLGLQHSFLNDEKRIQTFCDAFDLKHKESVHMCRWVLVCMGVTQEHVSEHWQWVNTNYEKIASWVWEWFRIYNL